MANYLDNIFVAFEGIDGAGKETQMHLLIDEVRSDSNLPCLGNKYSNVWVTREPTKITENGKKISNLLRTKKITGRNSLELLIKDRQEHSQIIKEQLKHSFVFTSRFDLSSFAYQSNLDETISFEEIYDLHQFSKKKTLVPDLTIIFDLPEKIGLKRARSRTDKEEATEKISIQKVARENYLLASDWWKQNYNRSIIIVDASKSISKVKQEMLVKIEEWCMSYTPSR